MNCKYVIANCLLLLSGITLTVETSAQSAIDARAISSTDLRGTARFMSMGGAFTALGGDISTLGQNPAGIGIYRSSEVGISVNLDFQSGKSNSNGFKESISQTKFTCNNFGYVGNAYTGSEVMPYFSWGVSYSRAADFSRRYRGTFQNLNGSLTNYVAGFTSAERWQTNDLLDGKNNWNPYYDTSAPWSSILFYNSYLINPVNGTDDQYAGLWQNGTTGSGAFDVVEKGQVDEYNIDFGGNFVDMVYWGVGFGITDLSFDKMVYYEEDFNNALVVTEDGNHTTTGNGGYGLEGVTHIDGNGFNFKAGVIIKPINELRIGLAVHTPTYYTISNQFNGGSVDYGFSTGYNNKIEYANGGTSAYADWKLKTPWRLMAGVAGVIGKQGIVSVDYEYRPYQDMRMSSTGGNEFTYMNDDIANYYQATHQIRLGVEYRLTPSFSLRAGYTYETTSSTKEVSDNQIPVYTSGVDDTGLIPSYDLMNNVQNISVGIGYRYKNFYIDAAYVNKRLGSTFHAYTPNDYTLAPPQSKLTNFNNQVVVGLGFKF